LRGVRFTRPAPGHSQDVVLGSHPRAVPASLHAGSRPDWFGGGVTLAQRTRQTATRQNRQRQHRTEVRLEEIVKVAGIADTYSEADRRGDLAIETHFARLYQLVDTDAERDAVVAAYRVWAKSEQIEDLAVTGSVEESVGMLKVNNNLWLDDGCGPDGRAA
jgi:hypothetical protein